MSEFAVELQGVSKKFGGQYAVRPMDLAIPTGSIYGFIGPNGSGKTTTMRMILRIYKPDTGIVRVLGESDGNCADDRVGYLPEERGLYRRMTVRRVLRYFAKIKGCKSPDDNIDRWMTLLGANDWYNKRIDQLSKGMAQKVQFVAAVAASPQLVILDEPFSGLDPVNMEILRDAVLQLRKEGTTVILSTHDMSMAQQLCDCVCMIFRGNKVLDGTIDHVARTHGEPRLRIGTTGRTPIPEKLPGVLQQINRGRFVDLTLTSDADKKEILRTILQHADLEHFELVQPSLHDIFVQIASPGDSRQPDS